MFEYAAIVDRVIDGDTLAVRIDLGFDTWWKGSIRLLGINARELHDEGGQEAKENLSRMLPPGSVVIAQTVKRDKFAGRYDARVLTASGEQITPELIAKQWAAPWDGRGERPVPPWPRTV